jgi:DNA (cytosine-5)-methyltransferase 1
MQTIETKNVLQNRGKPRVWFQGKQPARAGFSPGARYSVEIIKHKQMVALKLSDAGDHVVSKKDKNGELIPIIDLNSDEVLGMFAGMDVIRVIIKDRAIYLLPLATEVRKKERLDLLKQKLANNESLAVGSLSHGGGVMSHAIHAGLESAGIKSHLAFANDIDVEILEHAQRTNSVWSEETVFFGMPMQELAFDEYAMTNLPRVQILELGIPCTAHSIAAVSRKKENTLPEDDPHVGHLVVAALTIIARSNAAIVTLENVSLYQKSASMSILRNQLKDMGYVVSERILKATDWNCLEARERLCMVAVTEGITFDFDELMVPEKINRTLGEILDCVPDDDATWSEVQYLKDKQIRDAAKGSSFAMQLFDEQSSHINTLRRGYQKGGSSDPRIIHPTNPNLSRLVSPREHAKCKGIPEDLIAGLSKTNAHALLGQSIAYPPFVAVGQLIAHTIRNKEINDLVRNCMKMKLPTDSVQHEEKQLALLAD